MCGTQTSAVCLFCLFTVSVPSPGCVGLGHVLCVCLDVWDSDKCCVFVWMCGTRTSAVCWSRCVEPRQVMCVCLDVWYSDKCCVFVWMCGTHTSAVCLSGCVGETNTQRLSESHTSRQTHSTCLSPIHPDKHTTLV
jgi:hypothetical protein